MSEDETLVRIEVRDSILWIVLNRPAKANALTIGMMETMAEAIRDAGAQEGVRAVVLCAPGARIFCAGVDVKEQSPDGDAARQRERRSIALARLQDAVIDSAKPVVVAVEGAAIGAGAMLAWLADACVAATAASFSLPEIDIGIPTFSGASIVEAVAGRSAAMDLVLTGRRMPAADASARGLVRELAESGVLQDRAGELAASLGEKGAFAYAQVKRWMNRGVKRALDEARKEHERHRAAIRN
ncbi:MAG: enoyl-CoA hydratase/isomerase family protein [Alcaligenaceae bacterium]|nr:enoyl-CoA hydratase/isomerase family protein [Alcaligenaceae bacterium SAGV5]MPS54857.1 enoyl-CoA hydratase/isomerase family protein [Alcaligenaceae bacterium SAGV3]MPT60077.1 enoyl-CoA hydratase/isomerase family protein [Alcaligenaceae bacterium]